MRPGRATCLPSQKIQQKSGATVPLYTYKAIDKTGARRKGGVYKNTQAEAERELLATYPHLLSLQKNWRPYGKFTKKETAEFCRSVYLFNEAGFTVAAALGHARDKLGNKNMRAVLTQLYESVQCGESLWQSMRACGVFEDLLVEMIKVGEQGGALSPALEKMSVFYDKEYAAREELKNALIYPAVLALMMVATIFVFVAYVVPSYAAVFLSGDMPLPLPTRVLLGTVEALTRHAGAVALGLAGLAGGAAVFARGAAGRFCVDWLKLYCVGLRGLHRKRLNLEFTQALHILLSAGMDVAPALEAAGAVVSNSITRAAFRRACLQMRQGTPLERLPDGVPGLDPEVADMLRVGGETGALPQVMRHCAEQCRASLTLATARFNKLLEPAIIVALGGLLTFIMLAVLLPTFYMINFV
jgi:type II secretory pathway component PulF